MANPVAGRKRAAHQWASAAQRAEAGCV